MFRDIVDIREEKLLKFNKDLLKILLRDNSSKKSIIWATDNYVTYGKGFRKQDAITVDKITGKYKDIIKPRIKKKKSEQNKRIKDKAEVFTPSWICNIQNNLVDEGWLKYKNAFNKEDDTSWITTNKKIKFPKGLTWQDYIKSNRLEITCGEAPYMVSRYDTVTGTPIEITNRIGFVDRKFRVLNENVDDEELWTKWSLELMKSCYGFDWQGDNVLLARENVLYTYSDYFKYKFDKYPGEDLIIEVAKILSWNIWQMDGLNCIIPYSCTKEEKKQLSLFPTNDELEECEGCKKNDPYKHNGIYSKIMDWETGRSKKYISLIKGKIRL